MARDKSTSRSAAEVSSNAVDLTYRGTPLEDLWKTHGYIGVFFASDIQPPEDLAIQFIRVAGWFSPHRVFEQRVCLELKRLTPS